jgi:hypothetical protein
MFHDGGDGEIPMLDQIQNNNFIVSVVSKSVAK